MTIGGILFVFLALLRVLPCVNAFLDIRIKSPSTPQPRLSSFEANKTRSFSQEHILDALDNIIRLDISGHVQCNVIGPSPQHYGESEPFIETASDNPLLPRLLVGYGYDFARSPFGLYSLETTLQWRRLLSHTASLVQLKRTQSLGQEQSSCACYHEALLQYHLPNRYNLPVAVMRVEQHGGSTLLSCSLPLYRRLQYCWQLQHTHQRSAMDHARLQQHEYSQEGREWWLPDVSIRPNGLLESINTAQVRHPFRKNTGHIDARLMIRRRLQLNAFGSPAVGLVHSNDNDDEYGTTSVAIELQERQTNNKHYCSTWAVRLNTYLERPLESVQLSVIQQTSTCTRTARVCS